jgi:hypothetical protein
LAVVDIEKKAIVCVYKDSFKEDFFYRLSTNGTYIILITRDKILQKIEVVNEDELKYEHHQFHEPGLTSLISFDKDSNYFTCGGNASSDLIIYSSSLIKVNTIEQHRQTSNLSFFTKANRLVTCG